MRWAYDIVFVDNENIRDPLLLGISRNLTEFWGYRFADTAGVKNVMVVSSHDIALKLIRASKSDFVVVAAIGNTFEYESPQGFLEAVDSVIDKRTFVMGHVLDCGERYYELHHQCFVINVAAFNEVQNALPSPINYTPRTGTKPVVKRSKENFHDNYTPIWVNRGDGNVDVADPAMGADLIAHGITHSTVRAFPENVRASKLFLYPEKTSHRTNLNHLLKRAGNRNRHYAFSYEPLPEGLKNIGPLDYIACPCNGLNVFRYLKVAGMNEGARIQLYDVNPLSVRIYERIMTDWDGVNYDSLFDGLDIMVRGLHQKTYWHEFLSLFGGIPGWLDFLKKVRRQKVSIEVADLLDVSSFRRWDAHGTALFVASNIFDFTETGIFYNTDHRYMAYQSLLQHLPERAWIDAIFPLRDNPRLSPVGDERLKTIYRFPWRK